MSNEKTIEMSLELAESLLDSEKCWFDHHGGCQEHGYLELAPGEKCPQQELRELVERERGEENKVIVDAVAERLRHFRGHFDKDATQEAKAILDIAGVRHG